MLVLSHPAVQQVHIRGEEATATRAYLRMRLILQSQDVVEVFVYLVAEGEVVRPQDYSLHWQRADGALLQRWDTAPHHPGIATFPSHTHRATGEVEPATALESVPERMVTIHWSGWKCGRFRKPVEYRVW
jgi:hypothetical protein